MLVIMWAFSIRLIILFVCKAISASLKIPPLKLSSNITIKSKVDAGEIKPVLDLQI